MSDTEESPYIVQTGGNPKPKKHKSKKHRKDNISSSDVRSSSKSGGDPDNHTQESEDKLSFWEKYKGYVGIFIAIVVFLLIAYFASTTFVANKAAANSATTEDTGQENDAVESFNVEEEVHKLRQLQDRLLG